MFLVNRKGSARIDPEAVSDFLLSLKVQPTTIGNCAVAVRAFLRFLSALARDPTEALAWLATLTASPSELRAVDPGVVWSIVEETLGRGVASRGLVGHTGEVHWVEAIPGTADFVSGAYPGRSNPGW